MMDLCEFVLSAQSSWFSPTAFFSPRFYLQNVASCLIYLTLFQACHEHRPVIFLSFVSFPLVAGVGATGHRAPVKRSNNFVVCAVGCGTEMGSKVTADLWMLHVRLAQGFFFSGCVLLQRGKSTSLALRGRRVKTSFLNKTSTLKRRDTSLVGKGEMSGLSSMLCISLTSAVEAGLGADCPASVQLFKKESLCSPRLPSNPLPHSLHSFKLLRWVKWASDRQQSSQTQSWFNPRGMTVMFTRCGRSSVSCIRNLITLP